MKTIYIERSTGGVRDGDWVESLDLEGVERIVVGTGPGSFAGIRSAIAFATGYSLGRKCEVLGLPSPCAVAAQFFSQRGAIESSPSAGLAVVGDARRGKFWIALFNGLELLREVFQTDAEGLEATIPADFAVATPDAQRIGNLLSEKFGGRYAGGMAPDEEGLRLFAEANPEMLKPEPLPIYLNPAVRD
jgi:tRNA A37 threonylcarbamoyladenosine modification protein TsaB